MQKNKTKKNKILRYYESNIVMLLLGAVITVGGYLLWYYSMDLWRLGAPIMCVGVGLVIAFFTMRVDDSYYTEYMDIKLRAMPTDIDRRPDHILEGYAFGDNNYIKFDAEGFPRSETYVLTHIYIEKKLRIVIGTVNAEKDSADFKEYEFKSAVTHVDEYAVTSGTSRKMTARMTVSSDEAECSFPAYYNDIEVDRLCEKLNELYNK